MVETQSVQYPTFTTIQFITKDGEKCTATKNNGIVTVQGDKNGIRQVPVEQFMKELVETLPKNVDLARTPAKDTVQFSGNETAANPNETKAEVNIEETNNKLNKKFLAIGAGALAVLGTGIYLLGKGRWWSKAAQEVERKGQELAEDATNAVREGIHGGNKGGNSAAKTNDDVVAQAEELIGKKTGAPISEEWKAAYETDPANVLKTGTIDKNGIVTVKNEAGEVTARYVLSESKPPKIYAMDDLSAVNPDGTIRRVFYMNGKPWSYTNVAKDEPLPMAINRQRLNEISEEFKQKTGETPKTESPEPKPTKSEQNLYEQKLPKSPIPESELLEIPKDLETDAIKVIQNGHIQNIHATEYLVIPPSGLTKRVYCLDPDILHVEKVLEYSKDGTTPFRKIYFTNGQVSKIEDLTSVEPRVREFPVQKPKPKTTQVAEKPKQEVPPQPKPEPVKPQKQDNGDELFRQQEAETLRLQKEQEAIDNANNDVVNAAVIAEVLSGAGKKGAQQVTERAGQTIADATPKIRIPKPETVTQDGEHAARDLFGHNPKPTGEAPISTPETAMDDIIKPNTDDIIRPNTDDIIPPSSDFVEMPKTDYEIGLPGTTIEEPVVQIETPQIDVTDGFMDGSAFG
ncbi:hypothetical protein IKP85_04245 [bacterium]|nr:hypothetical protein [bacterium]